jgi:Trk-type K+ transport system membrane component
MISEGWAANGSKTAVAQSGTSIMSDSLIAFHPAIDEPSNITPSFRKFSLIVRT